MKTFSAGLDQLQDVFGAFEVLVNEGFLHDQGVLTLEAVQMFYELILEEPERAIMIEEKLVDFCQSNSDENQPVVILMVKSLNESREYYHAVTMKRASIGYILTDSRPNMGEISFPLSEVAKFETGETFDIFDTKAEEEWSLGDQICYYIQFN